MNRKNTSIRLKEIMKQRNLRQTDIIELTKPYCQKYDVKMNKSDISQYVSGKVEPSQAKLVILSMALNVSESWLMGFDVPKERNIFSNNFEKSNFKDLECFTCDSIIFEITERSLKHSPEIFNAIIEQTKKLFSQIDCDTIYRKDVDVHNIYELLMHPDVSFSEKVFVLKNIINFVVYDTRKNSLSICYNVVPDPSNIVLNEIQYNCSKLNIDGLQKVCDYTSDLTSIQQYISPTS